MPLLSSLLEGISSCGNDYRKSSSELPRQKALILRRRCRQSVILHSRRGATSLLAAFLIVGGFCTLAASSMVLAPTAPAPACPTSEVVGAKGRMGSQWLRRQPHSVAVPRGVCPGSLAPAHTPIYVCTPATAWKEIYASCTRQDDLVWVGNGLVADEFQNTTVVIPHYGILTVGALPSTSPASPATLVYGKHAETVCKVLEADQIRVEIVKSFPAIQVAAARKLLWASCLWLLCHSDANGGEAIPAACVHQRHAARLEQLVAELLPVLQHVVKTKVHLTETLAYLQAYSESMPTAIPNLQLALHEVRERNGVWLAHQEQYPQPLHQRLIKNVGGEAALKALDRTKVPTTSHSKKRMVRLHEIGISLTGTSSRTVPQEDAVSPPPQSVIVVGAGILGSAMAMNLSRRCPGVNVTVLEGLPSHTVGLATPASWAWLNANQKSPVEYKWLNQLGMTSWRRDKALFDLPTWSGSLVQYKTALEPLAMAGYETLGPLSPERLRQLEPNATFHAANNKSGPIYYFPQEGSVDPSAAVWEMRRVAKEAGAVFLHEQNVTGLIRDKSSRVVGVEYEHVNSSQSHQVKRKILHADVVVLATGAQSNNVTLGGIPLRHSPGSTVHALPRSDFDAKRGLSRILVDTVNETHILQRKDGTLVAGGGFLELGGSSPRQEETPPESDLLAGARKLAPTPLGQSSFSHVAQAMRPMPLDGMPVAGFLEPGLYVLVTHSGVTLAPFLTAASAAEIAEHVDLDILSKYRPQRFERTRNESDRDTP